MARRQYIQIHPERWTAPAAEEYPALLARDSRSGSSSPFQLTVPWQKKYRLSTAHPVLQRTQHHSKRQRKKSQAELVSAAWYLQLLRLHTVHTLHTPDVPTPLQRASQDLRSPIYFTQRRTSRRLSSDPLGGLHAVQAAAPTPSRPHSVCPSCSPRVSRARYYPLLVSAWKRLNPISYPALSTLQLFVPVFDRFAEVDLNIWDQVRCLSFPLSRPAALPISSRKHPTFDFA